MKKVLALLLIGVMILSMFGCGNASKSTTTETAKSSTDETTEGTEATGGQLFGYTCMDMTNPFHIAMRDAIQAAVEENGDTLVAIDGQANQSKQNDVIEDLITQGIKVLFLNPVDSQSIQPALEACAEAGVKVINVDSAVADLSLVATYIASNNVTAGKQCGEELVKLYPDGAKICIIENPLAESVVQRVQGLEEAIKGTNVEIVGRKSIATMDVVLSTAEDLLQANPDVDAFWGLNDDVSLIIQGAVESADLTDQIKVFSVDGSPSGKKSVADGGLYATAAQSPSQIGLLAVDCAYKLLAGESIESTYSVDTQLVNTDNIADFDTANWN
ncbi:MAG: rbsB1 [Lachnospiraceae bacterium]|nr:rbsB1 [Lachnospiraceae bacterium]